MSAREGTDGDSQEGLYLLLGKFLREHGLEYPQDTPLVRFALSNKGDKGVYLDGVRLTFRTGNLLFGDRLVLDPLENRVLPLGLAEGWPTSSVRRGRSQWNLSLGTA